MVSDEYFLGYRQPEQQRLQQQAHLLAHDSSWLLNQLGSTAKEGKYPKKILPTIS